MGTSHSSPNSKPRKAEERNGDHGLRPNSHAPDPTTTRPRPNSKLLQILSRWSGERFGLHTLQSRSSSMPSSLTVRSAGPSSQACSSMISKSDTESIPTSDEISIARKAIARHQSTPRQSWFAEHLVEKAEKLSELGITLEDSRTGEDIQNQAD